MQRWQLNCNEEGNKAVFTSCFAQKEVDDRKSLIYQRTAKYLNQYDRVMGKLGHAI